MNFSAYTLLFTNKLLPLLLAILGFGLLITVHELGHFIFCKIFNIHTPTFSIGMGPTIYEKKIGQTMFRIASIPFGGYVEIAGQAEVGQGKQEFARDKSERSFSTKPYWQKALVLLGGVLFNLLFAYLIFIALFSFGIPKQSGKIIVNQVVENSAASKYGLQPKDQIVAINNKIFSKEPEKLILEMQNVLLKEIVKNPEKKITLKINRDEKEIDLKIKLGSMKRNKKKIGSLGAMLEPSMTTIKGEYQKYPFIQSVKKGIQTTHNLLMQMLHGLKVLIQQRSLKGAGGPVMILSKSFESAQKGPISLFMFLAIISINLAIINILPFGALDGGQLLFVTIEAVIRREIPQVIKLAINLASWIILISLILYISFKDVIRLFNGR